MEESEDAQCYFVPDPSMMLVGFAEPETEVIKEPKRIKAVYKAILEHPRFAYLRQCEQVKIANGFVHNWGTPEDRRWARALYRHIFYNKEYPAFVY